MVWSSSNRDFNNQFETFFLNNSIRFLSHYDIDEEEWDKCIDLSQNALVYAYSWYLNSVTEDWGAVVLTNGHHGYDAVMPIPTGKKMLIYYWYQPPFCQQLGLFSKGSITKELLSNFLDVVPKSIKYIDANLNEFTKLNLDSFQIEERPNYKLKLDRNYSDILKGFNQNTKRNLKKAENQNWQFTDELEPKLAYQFFKENLKGKGEWENPKHVLMFKRLLEELNGKEFFKIVGAFDEKQNLCGSIFWLTACKRSVYLVAASNESGRRGAALTWLVNKEIELRNKTDWEIDFEGSIHPGIARFFKGFGADLHPYLHIERNLLPWYIRWIKT